MSNQTQTTSRKAEGFTFGVEIECFLPAAAYDEYRIPRGGYHHGAMMPQPFPAGWEAQTDGSLHTDRRGYYAIEIVSPILRGREGIDQVKRVAKLLTDMGAHTNPTCGFHVHVGVESVAGNDDEQIADWIGRLLYHASATEKAMYASTGTRRRERGHYAATINGNKGTADTLRKARGLHKKVDALNNAAYNGGRYRSLNLTNILNHSKRTVEFRAFAGTTEWTKMLGHIQMALAICERATETARLDWAAVASERTYSGRGAGSKALNRFFYLAGWTKGRRGVGKDELEMAGWIADPADLAEVKLELKRLARKYDRDEVA